VVTGPTTTTYDIPALKPGTYYFHCDVHPTMNGTATVR
jgi:plastocyanin